jgi:hypothetical protein
LLTLVLFRASEACLKDAHVPFGPCRCDAAVVTDQDLTRIARLLTERNAIDGAIASIIDRPMTSGHLGEWIAAQVFDIELERSATTAAIDGRFCSGPLQGQTVNVKWYLKQEGLLDISESPALDYYLVLTGPRSSLLTSRGGTRPWRIDHVYLFHAPTLLAEQRSRGVKTGVAASVLKRHWTSAEIYPDRFNPRLPLSDRQIRLLELFQPS